jgi:site-specific recombinase XerD
MASLTTLSNSPYWMARMRVWNAATDHPAGGYWMQTIRSTKLPHLSTPKRTAKKVADEMEAIGRELRDQTPDAVWANSRLDALLRAAGKNGSRRRTTWEKAAQSYLDAKTAKPRSMESYVKHCAHFTEFLGQRTRHDLRSITPDDISEFYHSLTRRGLSTLTAQQVTKTVRAVFHRALHLQHIEANPAALLRMTSTESTSKRKTFSPADIAAILKAADAQWRTACLFGLYYGMRLGDAIHRRYEEIQDGILRFTPEKKSRRGKIVAVPLVGELASLASTSGQRGYITPGLASLSNAVASKHFSRLLDSAGITRTKTQKKGQGRGMTDKTFHSWRHTINSLMVDAGIDQRVRQLICDHDSTKISNAYTHASITTMADAITRSVPPLKRKARSAGRAAASPNKPD